MEAAVCAVEVDLVARAVGELGRGDRERVLVVGFAGGGDGTTVEDEAHAARGESLVVAECEHQVFCGRGGEPVLAVAEGLGVGDRVGDGEGGDGGVDCYHVGVAAGEGVEADLVGEACFVHGLHLVGACLGDREREVAALALEAGDDFAVLDELHGVHARRGVGGGAADGDVAGGGVVAVGVDLASGCAEVGELWAFVVVGDSDGLAGGAAKLVGDAQRGLAGLAGQVDGGSGAADAHRVPLVGRGGHDLRVGADRCCEGGEGRVEAPRGAGGRVERHGCDRRFADGGVCAEREGRVVPCDGGGAGRWDATGADSVGAVRECERAGVGGDDSGHGDGGCAGVGGEDARSVHALVGVNDIDDAGGGRDVGGELVHAHCCLACCGEGAGSVVASHFDAGDRRAGLWGNGGGASPLAGLVVASEVEVNGRCRGGRCSDGCGGDGGGGLGGAESVGGERCGRDCGCGGGECQEGSDAHCRLGRLPGSHS